jgi:CheY-like chemotaxis protein
LQERSLRKLGFEVVGCTSGEEAIAYLEINDVDLIVSDLRMPGSVNGLKLLDWVRQNRVELQGRFLLISGDQLEAGTGQLPIPADVPCLKKPFEISAYCRTVSEILQK